MMLLEVTTDNLYDPVVALYEGLFEGERDVTVRLTVKEGFNPFLLQDFLSLVEDGGNDFGASVDLEVIDDARILQ
ncbi:hypothetical protein [uncultured Bilophila sp.]|uniref:hypothetical protein n=1 Tax=uncultured Bilophila sp. TaxID=529385 RepID=UPI0026DAE413|nr:hypothetical protein [uncultured Bilophila sp.]